MFRPGAWNLAVAQRASGANMSVDVTIGSLDTFGFVMVKTSASAETYGWFDATINVTVTTADPSNPRIDTLVAYIDNSLITTSTTNNVGALKFKVVAGTAAASPAAPNSSAIQTSIGSGNPYIVGPNIAIGTPGSYSPPSSILTGYLSGSFAPLALNLNSIWSGSAIGALIATTDIGSISTAMIAASAVTPAKMSAVKLSGVGGAYSAGAPIANGAFLMQAGSTVVTVDSNGNGSFAWPSVFPNGVLTVIASNGDQNLGATGVSAIGASISNTTCWLHQNVAAGAYRFNWIAIGW